MKQKLISLLLLVMAFSLQTPTFAQDKKDKGDKKEMKAKVRLTPEQRITQQTTYLVRELMLDDATAAKFAPVYKNYQNDLQACQNQCREAYGPAGQDGKQKMTDAQIEKRIEGRFAQAHQLLNIREKYYREFKKFLNPRQIEKMYRTEKNIHKKVRKERERRQNSLQRSRH